MKNVTSTTTTQFASDDNIQMQQDRVDHTDVPPRFEAGVNKSMQVILTLPVGIITNVTRRHTVQINDATLRGVVEPPHVTH
jgi:hypothetical protein